MSYPTVLSPWYVVQRLSHGPSTYEDDVVLGVEYYTAMDEGGNVFQPERKRAMLFMSLQSASRVASAEGAEVRVLTTREEAEEFAR